jgi:glutamine amidotransferase-like uncharacterized protein
MARACRLGAVFAILMVLWAGCGQEKTTAPAPPPGAAKIAVYSGTGAWAESITAARKMFEWMGYTTEIVSAADINGKGLGGFNAMYVPGGDMYEYSQDISAAGKTNIKSFVSGGGAYIGICGGAYFASRSVSWRGSVLPMVPLGLFQGTASGPADAIVPYPDYGMCLVTIAGHDHPITTGQPDSVWTLYYWGPVLVPDAGASVTVIGRYDAVGQAAMVAFSYGEGRVFLVGAHPEIEEDSDRDGVAFGDELDDRGSDWDLMKSAVSWCLKKTP